MWEAIAANKRRSWLVMILMWVVLVVLGAAIGAYFDPRNGWQIGIVAAMGVWFLQFIAAFAAGDTLLLTSVGARKIEHDDAPQLWNVVEEMKIAAMLPKMPDVYVIDDDVPNAFAVGRKQDNAAVAVTSGLLSRLTRDELQGVIAHEIGHIHNLDVRFMTYATIMIGSIVMLSDIFLRMLFYGGGRRNNKDSGGGGPLAIAAIVLAILAPILAQFLYFACSRKREYLADACSAQFTRYPEGLASALLKISNNIKTAAISQSASRALAPMFIVNPLKGMSAVSLFSTHPPTEKRVAILRAMGGGAGYAAYEAAYRETNGGGVIGKKSLAGAAAVPARAATADADNKQDARDRAAKASDLIGRMGGLLMIDCPCGVKIKVPPKFKGGEIPCVRCGRVHAIPAAEIAFATGAVGGALYGGKEAAAPGQSAPGAAPMVYKRKNKGWESFRCKCGGTVQLSPNFSAPYIKCPACDTKIKIEH